MLTYIDWSCILFLGVLTVLMPPVMKTSDITIPKRDSMRTYIDWFCILFLGVLTVPMPPVMKTSEITIPKKDSMETYIYLPVLYFFPRCINCPHATSNENQ